MSSAEVIDDDELPRLFGSYLLLENFARGGMGDVYLAKSGGIAGLERTCVVKKLRTELSQDREYVTRFVDEARVVVTLNHANICNVFDVGRVATKTGDGVVDEYYLAMDYVSGRDLRTLMDRSRKQGRGVDVITSVHLVCEVLKALDYAHRRRHPVSGELLQLVHRDVSPQNVLVSYEGEVKLIDFGLAASRLKVERTQPNVVMGKMAYMPPEQARGDPIDARADLFACGVLLYELVTNERYYEGMTANDIWQVAGRGGFVPRAWGSIDPFLQVILGRALHADARRRMATCGELREELMGFAATRNGATAERALRSLMESIFADDIARERAAMARFGPITMAAYRSELHTTTSVTLVPPPAGVLDEATVHDGERPVVVSRPQTTEEGTPMPAPPSSSSGGLHDDPTRLQERPAHLLTDPDEPVTPAQPPIRDERIHDERTVLTQPVPRTPRPAKPTTSPDATQFVRAARRGPAAAPDDELTALQLGIDRRPLWIGAAVVVAFLIVGITIATSSEDPPPATTVAVTSTPPPPLSEPVVTTAPVIEAVPEPVAPIPVEPVEPIKPAKPIKLTTPTPTTPRSTTVKATPRDPPRPGEVVAVAPVVKPVAPVEKRKAVTAAAWGRFYRAHTKSACVQKLWDIRMNAQEAAFLVEYSDRIRACASELGKDL